MLQLQLKFNGSNTFETMKICSRQGKFELMSVNHSARSGGIIVIFVLFFNMKVCCIEAILMNYITYRYQYKKENHPKLFQI